MNFLRCSVRVARSKQLSGQRWLSTKSLDDEYFTLALRLAIQAGEVVKRGFYKRDKTVHTKIWAS